MKIAIIGASGFTGTPLVNLALEKGHEVYAISRSGAFEENKNLVVINESIINYEKIAKDIKDVDFIISTFNAGWDNPNLYADYIKGSNAAISLSKLIDKRIVIVGGASSLYDQKTNKQLYYSVPEDFQKIVKGAFDLYNNIKNDLSFKWTFISPALELEDYEPKRNYNIGGDYILYNDKNESKISIHDLADLLLTGALSEFNLHKRITLADK